MNLLMFREAPCSIPGISTIYFCHLLNLDILNIEHGRFFTRRGCSSVVERTLCMCEAPGSIPGISN